MANSTGKPFCDQYPHKHGASSALVNFKPPEQRAREYRARHKFNFLNSVTHHEKPFSFDAKYSVTRNEN